MTAMEKLYKGEKNLIAELGIWLKAVFTKGLWAFLPSIAAIGLGYYLHYNGFTPQEVKYRCEIDAVVIMSVVVLVFLVRVWKYGTMIDTVLFILAIAFLCREMHFAGTDNGVYMAVAFCVAFAWWHRDRILEELSGKGQLKAAIFGTCWAYLLAFLIQRRVFKPHRVPLLPDEAEVHITLEEVLENAAHLTFLAVGIIAFFYGRRIIVGGAGEETEEISNEK